MNDTKSLEGPVRIGESGHHQFHPFQYKHFGQFAPLGGDKTAAQLPGDWISIGYGSQWLWYSVYARYCKKTKSSYNFFVACLLA